MVVRRLSNSHFVPPVFKIPYFIDFVYYLAYFVGVICVDVIKLDFACIVVSVFIMELSTLIKSVVLIISYLTFIKIFAHCSFVVSATYLHAAPCHYYDSCVLFVLML